MTVPLYGGMVYSSFSYEGCPPVGFENTHGFMEIAIPWGDGRYVINDFGKFACKYHQLAF